MRLIKQLKNRKNITKIIAINAVVASLYVVLTMPFGVIATGPFQFRPAEALCILPAVAPYTVIGLFIGCAISNLVSAFGIFDIILGSLVTLIAGILTSTKLFRKPYLAPIPPILLNAFLLPLIWLLAPEAPEAMYILNVAYLLVSQSVVLYVLGLPLYFLAQKQLLRFMELTMPDEVTEETENTMENKKDEI